VSDKESQKSGEAIGDRVDAALASWPMPDRGAAAWENLATRTEARVARATADKEGADLAASLLDPPLPASPPEVQESASFGSGQSSSVSRRLNVAPVSRTAVGAGESKMSQPPERGRDRRSLQDLAKLASAPSLTPNPPPSTAKAPSSSHVPAAPPKGAMGDSGVVDLKMMAQLDPGAAERAKDTKLASAELFDEEGEQASSPASTKAETGKPSSSRAPAVAAKAEAETSRASSAAPSRSTPAPARPAPKTGDDKSNSWVWIGGVAGLLAVAAAAVVMLQSPSATPTAVSPPPAAPPVTAAAPTAKPAPAEHVAAVDTAAPAKDKNEVDLSSLPPAPDEAHAAAAGAKAVAAGPKKTVTLPGASAVAAAEPPKAATPNPSLVAKDIPMSPTTTGALQDALRQAAGPTDNPSGAGTTTPSGPQFDPGSVPQKPSAGAIAGGVSAAMAEARSCLGLDDPISRAAVTFESGGSVQGVVVSGFAAGKPAEACIKAALGKAKVPPFAQPTYTQTLTVRPNS
jgi:LPXTG-motif cell wall-anchored protein